MPRTFYDTFTEATDTELDGRAVETRPGSETWEVSGGTGILEVRATNDKVMVASTGQQRAAVNSGMTGYGKVAADFTFNSTSTATYPGVNWFTSGTAPDHQSALWLFPGHAGSRYYFQYKSPSDPISQVATATLTIPSTANLAIERDGNYAYALIDGIVRATLTVSGTTDFKATSTLYPGITVDDRTADTEVDNFETRADGSISIGTGVFTVTGADATLTYSGAAASVAVAVGVDAVQITAHNPTVSVVGPSSDGLTINASAVAVRENGHAVRYESLADHPVRNYRGTCISAITTARGYRRIWSMQTPPMTTAAAACFEADVSTGDLFSVTGFLVGSSTLTAAIANIQREDSPLFASFSFDLVESL